MPLSEDPANPAPVENVLVPTATGHHDPDELEQTSEEEAEEDRAEDCPPA